MIESELGEGSCFTVVIPFRLDRQAKAQEKEEAADADITGLRILVAEDNELNMEIARFILEDCGALVEPVSNGLEAVHKFEASAEEAFDVILMDIMMPVMDGNYCDQNNTCHGASGRLDNSNHSDDGKCL